LTLTEKGHLCDREDILPKALENLEEKNPGESSACSIELKHLFAFIAQT
jgi:hypothetical protein